MQGPFGALQTSSLAFFVINAISVYIRFVLLHSTNKEVCTEMNLRCESVKNKTFYILMFQTCLTRETG
jgi:hypothetical protein